MNASISRSQTLVTYASIVLLAVSLASCRSETKQAPPPATPQRPADEPKTPAQSKATEEPKSEPASPAEQPTSEAPQAAVTASMDATLAAATTGKGEAQYMAIDDLGETHASAATVVPALEKQLASDDVQVRWRSARALGDYGTLAQSAAPALLKLLADKDPIVQYHAVATLGKIGDRSDATLDALAAAVTSPDERVARSAIAALRQLKPGPERAMAALEKALASDDEAVTVHALNAIVERGAEAVPLLNAALAQPKTAYLACAAIESIGPAAAPTVPALVELIGKTEHSQMEIQALLALASIGPAAKAASPQIIPLLEHANDATVPVAAAYALGSIEAADADAALRQALEKDNPFLEMIAAWALAKIHPEDETLVKQAVDKLTQGLASSDARIRTAAARGLEMLHAPPELVAPALLAVANEPDPDAATNVVNALASLGEKIVPKAAEALQKPEMQKLAVKVLTRLGPKAGGAVDQLVAALAGASPEFRTEIQIALGSIGSAAAPATAVLVEGVKSDDAGVRESALFALREIGPGAKDAVPALLAQAQADESFDAMAAAWALASIAPADADVAAKIVPLLAQNLSSPGEQIRGESAASLGAFGPAAKSAIGALTQVAKDDSSPTVRSTAEEAIAQINEAQ